MAQEIADSTLLDTWGSGGNIVEPDISKIIEGWQLGEQPPHEYMNWLQNAFGSKLNHILKNGVASWNNKTEYLAGSSAQHNGNIWLCKTTNTNSEPTDVNANWKRIITVESLTAVLGGYVALTGNQTIEGVKTFSSSPIAPTPTTGTQAANKDYADTKQSKSEISWNANTSSFIPNTLTNGVIIESGSNANGEYIKFADGTMICRNNFLNFVSSSGGQYFYFPAIFIDTSYCMSIEYRASTRTTVVAFNYNPLNTAYAHVFSNIDNALNVSYTCIGRWK